MEKHTVNSRGIRSVRYDEVSEVLEVEYASSGAYKYFDVPVSVYEWLLKADSKGKFVNRLVKDKYRYERIREPDHQPEDLQRLLEQSLDTPAENLDDM